MSFNYNTKLSRSRNLVNLALKSENNSAQRDDLGYKNNHYINTELCKY